MFEEKTNTFWKKATFCKIKKSLHCSLFRTGLCSRNLNKGKKTQWVIFVSYITTNVNVQSLECSERSSVRKTVITYHIKKDYFVFQGRLSSIIKAKIWGFVVFSTFLTSYDFRSDNGWLSNSKIGDAGKFIRNVGIIKPNNYQSPVVILFCFCPVHDL